MKRYLVTIAIITTLFSACCPMVSVNPLSPPTISDKRLEGIWKYVSKEGEEAYLHIGKESGNTMVALSVEHKKNRTLDTIKILFFVTKTNTNNYLNVRLEDLAKKVSKGKKGFIFLKYDFVDNNTLLVFHLNRQLIIAAIQENKLTGKITYKKKIVPKGTKNNGDTSEKTIDCVVITDTSKNLINYFESSKNEKLFLEEMKFIRVN